MTTYAENFRDYKQAKEDDDFHFAKVDLITTRLFRSRTKKTIDVARRVGVASWFRVDTGRYLFGLDIEELEQGYKAKKMMAEREKR
jgi:hypothetical protein